MMYRTYVKFLEKYYDVLGNTKTENGKKSEPVINERTTAENAVECTISNETFTAEKLVEKNEVQDEFPLAVSIDERIYEMWIGVNSSVKSNTSKAYCPSENS